MQPILNGNLSPATPVDVAHFALSAAQFFDRGRAGIAFKVGAEAANVRRFTLTVTDRLKRPALGNWLLNLWVGTGALGAPGGAQTVTFTKGTIKRTFAANQEWQVISDAAGVVEFDVDAGAGVQARAAMAELDGEVLTSGVQAWT